MADLSDFISSSELLYWSTSACTASAIAGNGLGERESVCECEGGTHTHLPRCSCQNLSECKRSYVCCCGDDEAEGEGGGPSSVVDSVTLFNSRLCGERERERSEVRGQRSVMLTKRS